MASLEEHLQELAELATAERAVTWELGDRFCVIVKEHGREALSKVAEILHRSLEWVRQRTRIAVAFPPEKRLPDVPFTIYRLVYSRAKALGMEPTELLDMALTNGWSERDIAAYGREKKRITWRKTCGWCNTAYSLTIDGGLTGTPIVCPVCLAEIAPEILQQARLALEQAGRGGLLGVIANEEARE